jgi:hypothetical protein
VWASGREARRCRRRGACRWCGAAVLATGAWAWDWGCDSPQLRVAMAAAVGSPQPRGAMAAAVAPVLLELPADEEVDQRSFTRAMAEALIRNMGGTVPRGTGVTVGVVKRALKDLLAGSIGASGDPRSAGPRDGVPNRSAVSTTDALVAGSAAARTPSALLYVMRQRLDNDAKPLPKSADALRKVRASLDLLQVAQRQKDPALYIDDVGVLQPAAWVRKLHRTVVATICLEDETMREARQNTLRTAIEEGLRESKAQKGVAEGGSSASVERATPIIALRVLGLAGRRRLMWEYYKVWCAKKPELSKAATMPYDDGSYMQTLFQVVSEHLREVGLPGSKEIVSIKAFRDLMCRWCLLSSHYLPPFQREFSETRRWSADDWQALPLIDPEDLDDLPSTLMVGKDDHHDEDQGSEREQIDRDLRQRRRLARGADESGDAPEDANV